MDVVDDAALFLDRVVDWFRGGAGFLEPIAKFFVGFLETFPVPRVIAGDFADEEAEGCGEDHPYGYEVCGVFSHATCSEGLCSWMTRCTVAREIPCSLAI